MASNSCSGSFIVTNGRVTIPGPIFIPGVVEDVVLVPDQPTFLPAARPPRPVRQPQASNNRNRFVIA